MDLDLVTDAKETVVQVRDLNKELLVLRLSFGQLKAAIKEAAAPLLAVLVPALTTAIRWATKLVRTVSQVIAGVLGFRVAQEKLQKVVSSTGKALKRTVAGFDELNRLQSKSGGSSVYTVEVEFPTALSARIQKIVDAINELLAPLKKIDLSPLRWEFERLKDSLKALWAECGAVLKELWNNVMVPFLTWVSEKLAPVLVKTLAEGVRLVHSALLALCDGFSALWQGAQPVVEFLGETALTVLTNLGDLFVSLREAIENGTINIREAFWAIGQDLNTLWQSSGLTLDKMKTGVAEYFLEMCTNIVSSSNDMLRQLRQGIYDIASSWDGSWSTLWDSAKKVAKGGINGLLAFINKLLSGVGSAANGVSDILNGLKLKVPDWVPQLGGKVFDFAMKYITVPQVPLLAKGAVLPANKPFLAMVGDQKHGTNIEAPLATIQEAVALTMRDQLSVLEAGFNATVAQLQLLRSTVGDIQVGDTVIGQAAQRYNDRLALLRGYTY